MNLFGGKNNQAKRTSDNLASMYSDNRPSEVNGDGTISKSEDSYNSLHRPFEKGGSGWDLQKGGEGSKGGKVIGHTKSGKAIYDKHDHPAHKGFTKQDHADAARVHASKVNDIHDAYEKTPEARTANHYKPTEEENEHDKQGKKHAEASGKDHFIGHYLAEKDERKKNKVIGNRLDGKPIHGSFDHEENKGMSKDDHAYAAALHGHEYKMAKREEREADEEYHFEQHEKHAAASK